MKTIKRQYDDPRIERVNRYNERRLERLKQLEQRGFIVDGPSGKWRLWTVVTRPLVRWGWITTAQVYYPIIKRMHAKRRWW